MHSKGPWKPCNMAFKGGEPDDNIWDVYSDDGELLAVSVSKSDARLIAAAPLMLEALKACDKLLDSLDAAHGHAGSLSRAAIAKAEGMTP